VKRASWVEAREEEVTRVREAFRLCYAREGLDVQSPRISTMLPQGTATSVRLVECASETGRWKAARADHDSGVTLLFLKSHIV